MNFILNKLRELKSRRINGKRAEDWQGVVNQSIAKKLGNPSPTYFANKLMEKVYKKPQAKIRIDDPKYHTQMPALTYQDIIKYTIDKARALGANPAVPVSQLAIESSRGTHPAVKKNNYFGYQAYDSNPSGARAFSSPTESVDSYFRLISEDPRYKKAWESRSNPYNFARAISASNYAGSESDYAKRAKNGYRTYADLIMDTPEYRQYSK